MRKLNTEEFIKRAREVHGNKYDYSKSVYIDARSPITIICPKHGEFYSIPDNHINKRSGCPYCSGIIPITTEEFIRRAKETHGNKYDYSKTVYTNNHTPLIITCPIHGDFEQIPSDHLSSLIPCPSCDLSRNVDTNKFIQKSKLIHGDRYIYDKVVYTGNRVPVVIICREHGEFLQRPHEHLIGHGCPICNGGKSITTEEFIKRAIKVHGNKYDYSKTRYINNHTHIIITCPEHGDFVQLPHNHLNGYGCPYCTQSKLEVKFKNFLILNNISFIEQATWDWLVFINNQRVDFYLPDLGIAVECQGIQHFLSNSFFDQRESFDLRWNKDLNKQRLCMLHGIPIYYFSDLSTLNNKYNYPYQVYEDPEELIINAMNINKLVL